MKNIAFLAMAMQCFLNSAGLKKVVIKITN